MKTSKLNSKLIAIIFLMTTGFTGTVWAECLAPEAKDYFGSDVNSLYTDVDGKLDSCPAGYTNGCLIEKGTSSCSFASTYPPDPSAPDVTFGVDVTVTRNVDASYTTQCDYEDPENYKIFDIAQ